MRHSIAALLRAFDDGRDKSEFYRGWRVGVSAGFTHPAILAQIGPRTGLAGAIRAHLLEGTTAGRSVEQCVRARPQLFEPFEAALLGMAEESGQLEPILGTLAEFQFKQFQMMQHVKKQMTYPLFVSLVAVVIGPLPLLFKVGTAAYVSTVVSGLLGWFFLGGSIFAGRAQRYQQRPAFVRARLARTLAMALEAGLALPRAVRLAGAASGDPSLDTFIKRIPERVLASQPLEVTFAGAPAISPDFIGALHVASQTGDYSTTLRRLAELYEDGFK